MHVRSLSLHYFRLYVRLELELPPAPILLVGGNAQGKTSLLEAIAYLSLGRSPLTTTDRQLIHRDAELMEGVAFARVGAEVVRRDRTERIEIALQRRTLNDGQARLEKRVTLDGRTVRRAALAGHLNVVTFLPEDVGLVGGSPSRRRRHLDNLLSQVYTDYVEALAAYQNALSQRNALLRHLREFGGDAAQLLPLEETLAQHGVVILRRRWHVLRALTTWADRFYRALMGPSAWLHLAYRPNFAPLYAGDERLVEVWPDEAELRATYRQAFLRWRAEALRRGVTVIGPHRDDVAFIAEDVELGIYGSRGQRRAAVLALRLAELRWLEAKTGETPVLLLDEVLAELDRTRRRHFLDLLGEVEQALLATTDADLFPADYRAGLHTLRVEGGIVTQEEGDGT